MSLPPSLSQGAPEVQKWFPRVPEWRYQASQVAASGFNQSHISPQTTVTLSSKIIFGNEIPTKFRDEFLRVPEWGSRSAKWQLWVQQIKGTVQKETTHNKI